MFTEEELKIANKSYINKDFATIYPELLDLIKIMTNRWDPQTSNESDPGIVLTKLNAFIADKNDYNIDKNVLENFMLSATQESSMRKLCDMIGYYVNYYIAPEVEVTIMYTKEITDNGFILPALETVVTSSEDESISFVLTTPAQILKQNIAVKVPAIQGELKTLMGNNSGDVDGHDANQELIQLNNLDDNNRVYFPESNVAQNGVFITTLSDTKESSYWTFTKNLNYEQSGNQVYKFGFDSNKGLPYVEFPDDIANLIENGLRIRYIVTDGLNGNIKANILNTLSSTSFESENYNFNIDDEEDNGLFIRNFSGSINGKDPETIDEAYNSFKKTIGTFDTLVTCRDYANAIYNMYDASNVYPVVSNVQVADRRDDFNYCTKVVSYDEYGVVTKNIHSDDITPYDLCCYPLNSIHAYDEKEFYNSFKPYYLSNYIQEELEEFKCASHDYKELDDSDVYLFKNYLTLNANLSTTYKVTDIERQDIVANVEKALIKNFNAREVDYGYEIPYDSLVKTIENADKRISSVNLAEPYLKTKVMFKDGDETNLVSAAGKDAYVNLLAKNILSGHVSLFDYDKNFNFEFGQSRVDNSYKMVTYEIDKIDTLANITLTNNQSYTLQPNEFIQLIAPNLITKTTYPVNVYYYLSSSQHPYTSPVANDTNYKLSKTNTNTHLSTISNGEKLVILYTDSNDIDHTIVYYCDASGDTWVKKDNENPEKKEFFIQPVKLKTSSNIGGLYSADDFMTDEDHDKWSYASYTATKRSGVVKNVYGEDILFYALLSSEELNIREKTQTILTTRTPCYWIRNNQENKLFNDDEWADDKTILLQDGEYFFYTDSTKTSFVSLGSGTTIKFPSGAGVTQTIACDRVSLDEVIDKGILAIDDWKYFTFTSALSCIMSENQILTLGYGDTIKLEGISSSITLDNTLQELDDMPTITYIIDGDPNTLENFEGTDIYWNIKSRLDIDVSSGDYQRLYSGQTIKLYDKNNQTTTPTTIMSASNDVEFINCFNLNAPSHLLGGSDIDVSIEIKNSEGSLIRREWPLNAYYYKLKLINSEEVVTPIRNELDYSILNDDELTTTYGIPMVNVDMTTSSNKSMVFMIYLNKQEGDSIHIDATYATLTACNSEAYSGVTISSNIATITKSGLYVFEVSSITNKDACISFGKSNNFKGTITLGTLDVINGINEDELGISDFATSTSVNIESDLLTVLRGLNFYYNYKPEKTKLIELDSNTTPKFDMLSPYILYDFNNVANKFTLSEIDFNASKIDVVRSSRL